jgi:hypothetical protein
VEVAVDDAIVDDVGVEIGQVEITDGLGHEQRDEYGNLTTEWSQISAK